VAAVFLLAACNDDGSGSSGGTGDTTSSGESSSGGSGGTSSGGSTDTGTEGTGSTSGSGSPTETGTGEPETPGSARIVYLAAEDIDEPHEAFYVEVTEGVAAPPIKITVDLGADDRTDDFEYAPSGDSMIYRLYRVDDYELHFVDLRTQPFAPVRINVAPAPVPGAPFDARFSPAGDHLLFRASNMAYQQWKLYRVDLTGDQPGAPLAISIPVADDGIVGRWYYSPDGARLAYPARLDEQAASNLYLGTPDPADAGIAVQVSDLTSPDTGLFIQGFTGDSAALLYTADRDEAGVDQLFAVDVASDPPGPPIMVNDPPGALSLGNALADPTGGRVIYWVGDPDTHLGDIYLSDVSGGTPTPPVRISTLGSPSEVIGRDLGWSPDGHWFHYTGHHLGPQQEAYLVDLSGPTPGPPVRVNSDLAQGAAVGTLVCSPDSARLYYFAGETDVSIGLYMVDLGGGVPGPGVLVSEELEFIWGQVIFGPEPHVLLYTGNDEGPAGDEHLYMVDVSTGTPYESVVLSDPDDDVSVSYSPDLSLDAKLAFYMGHGPEYGVWRLFMVDLSGDQPSPPIAISDEVGYMWFHVLGRPRR
jgi:Tol biopolymer transport system component